MTIIMLFRFILNNICFLFRIILILFPQNKNELKLFRSTYILKLFSLISLSIILLNLVNKSVYTHSHLTESGEIVIHAHPFDQHNDDSPLKSHNHSALEFLVLNALDIFTISIFLFSALKLTQVISYKNYSYKTLIKQTYFYYKQNKSPPFEIVFRPKIY